MKTYRWKGFKLVITVCLLFILVPLTAPGQTAHSVHYVPADSIEYLEYDLSYSVFASAKAIWKTVAIDSGRFKVTASVHTGPWTRLIFSIDNHYQSILDPVSCLPIRSRKNVDQTNIKQSLHIYYRHQKGLAKTQDGKTWPITPHSLDLFSFIHCLRTADSNAGDSLVYDIDLEGELWTATGRIQNGPRVEGAFSHLHTRWLEFSFSPLDPQQKGRPWKTDLLTHRIASKNASLIVILGSKPVSLPLKLVFGEKKHRVEMSLLSRTVSPITPLTGGASGH